MMSLVSGGTLATGHALNKEVSHRPKPTYVPVQHECTNRELKVMHLGLLTVNRTHRASVVSCQVGDTGVDRLEQQGAEAVQQGGTA